MSEVRGQKAEGEVKSQKSEIRDQRSEIRDQRRDIGFPRSSFSLLNSSTAQPLVHSLIA
jgi:hypothetical protein